LIAETSGSRTPWRTRKRLAVLSLIAVLVVVAVVSISWILTEEANATVNLDPNGFGQGNVQSCFALQFYLETGGTLKGSWSSNPASTAYLFSQDQFHTSSPNCQQGSWGTSVWNGKSNASSDSMSVEVQSGTYFLVFVPAAPGTNIMGSSLTLVPTQHPFP